MAGENDQTRWIGIRPTNPPETIPVEEQSPITEIDVEPAAGSADFPVTLGAEVPHVIVDSGGGAFVKPSQLFVPIYYLTPTVSGVWYTSVDVTAAGWLFWAAYRQQGAGWAGYIGITLDGGARQEMRMYGTMNRILPDFRNAANQAYGLTFPGLRFDTSLKIEYRQDGVGWHNGTCCYGLE